jgi:hypothetical protein
MPFPWWPLAAAISFAVANTVASLRSTTLGLVIVAVAAVPSGVVPLVLWLIAVRRNGDDAG